MSNAIAQHRRHFPLRDQPDGAQRQALGEQLRALSGVEAWQWHAKGLVLTYDVRDWDYPRLAAWLTQQGLALNEGRWASLRRRWYGFVDGNARDNLGHTPKPCCSNPTEVYAKQARQTPAGRRVGRGGD